MRINVGMLGWKYFWPGSKSSYTAPHPRHLPLIMSILYDYGPDSPLAQPIPASELVAAQTEFRNPPATTVASFMDDPHRLSTTMIFGLKLGQR